jgi:hypothetical protein
MVTPIHAIALRQVAVIDKIGDKKERWLFFEALGPATFYRKAYLDAPFKNVSGNPGWRTLSRGEKYT